MKILLLPIVYLVSTYTVNSQSEPKPFSLSGEIKGQKTGIVTLFYRLGEGEKILDSCELKNGKFHFSGQLSIPARATLQRVVNSKNDPDPENTTVIYLEPADIKVSMAYNNFQEPKVTGSKTHDESEELKKLYSAIKDTGQIRIQKGDLVAQEFVRTHPNSFVSVFDLYVHKNRWPFETMRSLYYSIDPKLLTGPEGLNLSRFMKRTEENTTGKPAKPFTTLDYRGNRVQLSDFKGKYVLLDFWASWCVPCREVNPHLVDIYAKFHNQGLEIISISVDKDKTAWLNAIEKDKIGIWHNVLSNMENNILIHELYGIGYYPTKILVGKDGMIIGRFSGTDDEILLDKKLAELF